MSQHVPLYMRQLRVMDVRFNHIENLHMNFGPMFLKANPMQLLISHNPLTQLREEGFGYGAIEDMSGLSVEELSAAILAQDSSTVAATVDATASVVHWNRDHLVVLWGHTRFCTCSLRTSW